jgi:hypothetical protein
MVSHAQVLFGSGGSTNTAPYSTNLAFGAAALASNTMGLYNTAIGVEALRSNNTGFYNTANGTFALYSNTAGYNNTANGFDALGSNITGFNNTANGFETLISNITGFQNTANGSYALFFNTTGFQNTANGFGALYFNTTGYNNIAIGEEALFSNTTGSENIAIGYAALSSNTTGSNNIALGSRAGVGTTIGSNNIAIGSSGPAAESNAIRIGTPGWQTSTYVAGINGVTASRGVPVFINANGQLGTITSSRRFKNAIKDMGPVTDRLMKLRPVTFRYKDSAEQGTHALQYGLIAEEVAKVYPDLVQYDKAGKPFTIYYHLLTPMLLNELQKAHHRYEAQQTEITALKAALQTQGSELASFKQSQQQQLNALAKLSALVETSGAKAQLRRAVYLRK